VDTVGSLAISYATGGNAGAFTGANAASRSPYET